MPKLMNDRKARVEQVNQVLETFYPSAKILLDSRNHLLLQWLTTSGSTSLRYWVTRGNDHYPVWHHRAPWGGTCSVAISQLIRWCQGKPVFGMDTWLWWANDRVALADERTIAVLREIGWPEKPICVLCERPCAGLDWWSLDGVSGPCCAYWNLSGCRQQKGNRDVVNTVSQS